MLPPSPPKRRFSPAYSLPQCGDPHSHTIRPTNTQGQSKTLKSSGSTLGRGILAAGPGCSSQ
jgi:hypothetical protein